MDDRYTANFRRVAEQRVVWHDRYIADQHLFRRERRALIVALKGIIDTDPQHRQEAWDRLRDSMHEETLIDDYREGNGNDVY